MSFNTEDFSKELESLPLEKLIKLLSVAQDYQKECWDEYMDQDAKVKTLQLQIQKRLLDK